MALLMESAKGPISKGLWPLLLPSHQVVEAHLMLGLHRISGGPLLGPTSYVGHEYTRMGH